MIEIRNLTKTKIDAKLLHKIAEAIFRKARSKRPSPLTEGLGLSVVFVGPKRAQELNTIYRKETYVPSVLSFEYGPPPFRRRGSLASPSRERSGSLWGGEIVLCPAKIRKDARTYGIVFEQELERIFRHGLLHLLGYSHKRMQKFEIPNFRL